MACHQRTQQHHQNVLRNFELTLMEHISHDDAAQWEYAPAES